jgi:hypothetical protein
MSLEDEDEFEKLIESLARCLDQARALHLQHAERLLKMTVMEVADRLMDHASKPTTPAESPSQPIFPHEIQWQARADLQRSNLSSHRRSLKRNKRARF